jgi:hypothetical protein
MEPASVPCIRKQLAKAAGESSWQKSAGGKDLADDLGIFGGRHEVVWLT